MQELEKLTNVEKLTPGKILMLARKGQLPVVSEETRTMSYVTLGTGQQLVLRLKYHDHPDFGPDIEAATLVEGSHRFQFGANGLHMLRHQFVGMEVDDDSEERGAERWIQGLPFAKHLAEGLFTFGTAPRPVQLAVLHRLAELGDLPSVGVDADAKGRAELEQAIEQAYDAVPVAYAVVPREVVIEAITKSWSWQKSAALGKDLTWEQCHAEYVRESGVASYPRLNRWPVLIATEMSEGDVIDDGWRRLHSYLDSGHETIPIAVVHHDESVIAGRSLSEIMNQKWNT